jgi:hypothetical protein
MARQSFIKTGIQGLTAGFRPPMAKPLKLEEKELSDYGGAPRTVECSFCGRKFNFKKEAEEHEENCPSEK